MSTEKTDAGEMETARARHPEAEAREGGETFAEIMERVRRYPIRTPHRSSTPSSGWIPGPVTRHDLPRRARR